MRLIDADAFYKTQKERCGGAIPFVGTCTADNEMLYPELKKAPTINAEPVRHGKWVAPDNEVTDYWRCSVCGEEYYFEFNSPFENNMHYCPNCGAKMDGE